MKRLTFIKTLTGAMAFGATNSLAVNPKISENILSLEKLREIHKQWKESWGLSYLIMADNPEILGEVFSESNICRNWGFNNKITLLRGIDIHKINRDGRVSFFYIFTKDFINDDNWITSLVIERQTPKDGIYIFNHHSDYYGQKYLH